MRAPQAVIISLFVFFVFTLQVTATQLDTFVEQTKWVLALDLKAVYASPLLKFVAQQFDTGKQLQSEHQIETFDAMFGFNLKRDLNQVVISGTGNAEQGFVAYVYGRFDIQRIKMFLSRINGQISSNYHGVVIYDWHDEKEDDRRCLAFPREGLALFSNQIGPLTNALDVLKKQQTGLSPDTALSKAVQATQGDILSLQAVDISSIVGSAIKTPVLQQAQALLLRIREPDAQTMQASLLVSTQDEQTAIQIQQALTGFQALAFLRASQEPEAAILASQLVITRKTKDVQVNVKLPKAHLQELLQKRSARLAHQQPNEHAETKLESTP